LSFKFPPGPRNGPASVVAGRRGEAKEAQI
jgi:hypothetical protein